MNHTVQIQTKSADMATALRAVAGGDRVAFRRLYELAGPVLFGICVRILRDRKLARDALQDAMVRIWQKSHLYDPAKGDALGWMAVVTRNCVLSRVSAQGSGVASLDDETVCAVAEKSLATHDPAVALDVRHCLEKLSDNYRQCVMMVY